MASDCMDVTVVMPVYERTDPSHFRVAVRSVLEQSRSPDEVLIVADGPLRPSHVEVINEAHASNPCVRRLNLARVGLAAALQAGITEARSNWIARMDADDIAMPNWLASQTAALREADVQLIGAAMDEFDAVPEQVIGTRRMPLSHDDIARRMRTRNPFNHPTVVFARESALRVGGYKELFGAEDYDLFARMLADGQSMCNQHESLVLYRGGGQMLRRRGSRRAIRAELSLQRNLVRYGLIGRWQAVWNATSRSIFRLLPAAPLRLAYRRLFLSDG